MFRWFYSALSIRVNAGALYYAILVSFLVALLLGFLMVSVRYHHYHTMSLLQGQRLERNVKSALVLAKEAPGLVGLEQPVSIDLFGAESDEVLLSKKQWGGFFLLKAEAAWKNHYSSAIEMCGSDVFLDDPVALYLADKERYLSVSGNTLLNGNCYLPKLGIRRAYIEGLSFTGDELVHGKVETSKPNLPEVDPTFLASNLTYFAGNDFPSDSMVSIKWLMSADTVGNSFYRKTVVFYSDQWINMQHQKLSGNVKIVSAKGVTLGSKLQCQDIIIFAPKVEVEAKFTGSVQLFARDSLIVREGARFLYPSLIALIDPTNKMPIIQIEQHCRIAGDIVLTAPKTRGDVQPECMLGEDCEVNGRIYCDGKLHLKGEVKGSVYCNGFILRTPSSLYENHLLNVTIDYKSLSKFYAGALFLKVPDRYKAVKWLY